MPRPSLPSVIAALVILVTAALIIAPAEAQTPKPKRGGILNSVLIEDPPGLLVHESATVSNVWPMSPCYSNLVLFDPLKPLESAETVVPELAEKWSWQDNYRNLVFFLRKNVKWHDGQPFTSADVKYTFDVGPRGAGRRRQAAHEPAKGLVRQCGGDRGPRAAHRGLPAQAAAAVAPADARLGLLAGLPGPRAGRRSAPALRGHRAFSAEGVRCAASSSSWSATRATSCPTGPTSTASATPSSASAGRGSPRSRPAASTPSCRSR